MSKPSFIIFAGCNGSGKSTYSKLLSEGVDVFDYDKTFLSYYNSMPDSELRELMAKNNTTQDFENLIDNSLEYRHSVAFETNFNTVPLQWIRKAKQLNYKTIIYFFTLDTLQRAKDRVLIRAKNKGHFVDDYIIEYKWKEGYKNINLFYHLVDNVVFIDNSIDEDIPTVIFEIIKINDILWEMNKVVEIPKYLKQRLPNIFDLIRE